MINTKNFDIKTFFEHSKETLVLNENRQELLLEIADTIVDEYLEREKLNLNFICTHNSRRSQFAQVWSFYAANYFNLENIFPFSGGTETTAFHRNTVRALQKSGFEFNVDNFSHQNPKYLISFKGCKAPLIGFSKTFDDQHNNYPYIAITTCDSADENCPFIPDAIERFHLPYEDPKISDNREDTKETYLETCQQIAGELFFIFEEVKKQVTD
ncbi:hypothetical protein [Tenacibaculum sp. 190524A02b]|uniref:Arsenate reductase n=1 Tax=Tenacibaculum vairaonense TaxID=3137860 RepID=A0ABM9PHP8_9FLAO